MLKNSLVVLSIIIFLGLSAVATIKAVQTLSDLARYQVEHDRMLTYNEP